MLTAVFAVILGFLSTLVIPPVYRSRASFVANTSSGSKTVAAGGANSPISGLLSEFGGSLGGDPSESPNFYLQLLSTRELLTRLLESRFPDPRTDIATDSARLIEIIKLKSSEPQRRMELGVKAMQRAIKGGMDPKTNLVWFSTDAQWPELGSQISNRLMALVSDFNRETRVSRAKSKRIFLERRLDSAGLQLRSDEERLRLFYETNRGLLNAPSLKFAEQRLVREVDVSSELFLRLQGQLEVARVDEINDAAIITVIDTAVAARKAQWPRYGAVLTTSLLIGLFAGLFFAGSAAVFEHWRVRNPAEWAALAESLNSEKAALRRMLGRGGSRHGNSRHDPASERPVVPAEPAA